MCIRASVLRLQNIELLNIWLRLVPAENLEVQIKNADMNEVLQTEVVELAKTAMDRFNTEKDIANFIKKELDRNHTPFWHCIVGRNFGSYVTHETKHFVYFYIDELAVLAFKAG